MLHRVGRGRHLNRRNRHAPDKGARIAANLVFGRRQMQHHGLSGGKNTGIVAIDGDKNRCTIVSQRADVGYGNGGRAT